MARKKDIKKVPTVNVRLKVPTWTKVKILALKRGLKSGSDMIDQWVENS